jgi:2-dehydropantoate 2-reductase
VRGIVLVPPRTFRVYTHVRQAASPYDYVLVATKAYSAAEVARQLTGSRAVGADTRIVLFMNGVGWAEDFRGHFPAGQLALARVITGFDKAAPNHVKVTVDGGPVRIGWLEAGPADGLAPLAAALTRGGLPTEAACDVWKDVWAKTAYNCAVNGLGAIHGMTLNQMLAAGLRPAIDETIGEVFEVMRAAGARTHWNSAAEYLRVFHQELAPRTGAHPSSMWRDLTAHKRTEVAYLNGAVVDLGKKYGVPVPRNQWVLSTIGRLEAGYLEAAA